MITVKDIAFVRYQVTDLECMEQFLVDFGLHRVARTERALYMRAVCAEHHSHISELGDKSATVGFGVLAQSHADLDRLAAHLANSSETELKLSALAPIGRPSPIRVVMTVTPVAKLRSTARK